MTNAELRRMVKKLDELTDRVRELEANQQTAWQRVAHGGAGGGVFIETVETLPDLPASGWRVVFWTSAGAGTGDDQFWFGEAGATVWTPFPNFTAKSGSPPA